MVKSPKNPGEICATCCRPKLGASLGAQARGRAGEKIRGRIILPRTICRSIPFGLGRCRFRVG